MNLSLKDLIILSSHMNIIYYKLLSPKALTKRNLVILVTSLLLQKAKLMNLMKDREFVKRDGEELEEEEVMSEGVVGDEVDR